MIRAGKPLIMNINITHLLFLCLTLCTCSVQGISQDVVYDEEYTVKYINDRLASKCQLQLERKNIVVEFYEKGRLVRVDHIFPESIDPEKIYYSAEEGAVIIKCFEKAGRCIDREIIKLKKKNGYDRCNLITKCAPEDCTGMATAVQHLINLFTLDDYERTKPFEEN